MTTSLDQLKQLADQVTPVSIPECFQRPEFRFCRVGYTKTRLQRKIAKIEAMTGPEAQQTAESALGEFKVPRGKGWQKEADEPQAEGWHTHDSDHLLKWISAGGNYGVCAGSEVGGDGVPVRLFLLDADDFAAWERSGFFDTVTTRTRVGRSSTDNKRHYYYWTDLVSVKAHEELPNLGHLKFFASQVVGPGSLHPSGTRYTLADPSAPAFIDAETLKEAILAATNAMTPSVLDKVRACFGVKPNHAGRLKKNVEHLEEKARQAKVERVKKMQRQEAQAQSIPDHTGTSTVTDLLAGIRADERINPCLRRMSEDIQKKAQHFGGETGHYMRRAWAVALIKSGYSDRDIHQLAEHFSDYTATRTQQQLDSIRSWVTEKGGNYYPCKEIGAHLPPETCQGCSWKPPERTQNAGQDTTTNDNTTQAPEITAKAADIVNSGRFIEHWTEVYHRRHNGDSHIAVAMPAANLTANIINSHGIAVVQVAGESGDGKSHAVEAAAEQMGRWCDISGLSPKALLYHGGKTVVEGMMVVLDDNRPDETQADIVKRNQTRYKTGYKYKTVINGKPVVLQMPPGVQLLTTEVDADSEDQVLNRTLLLEVAGNLEKDLKIIAADLKSLETGERPLDDPDICICQAAFDLLKSKSYVVTIPGGESRITWCERGKDKRANLRNYNIFRDLILAYAVMRWPLRPYQEENDVVHVEATRQDFMDALALYHTVHKQMKTKLGSREIEVLNYVSKKGGRVSREDVMRNLRLSKVRLTQLVRGKNGQSGLLGKVAGFYIEKATESKSMSGGEGYYDPKINRQYLCLSDTAVYQADLSSTALAATWTDQPS